MAKKPTTTKAVKKVAAKKAVKSAPAKKSIAAKAPAKKTAAKKTAALKPDPEAKAPAKAKKSPVASKVEKTSIIARVDVGFGNSLYIRGEGAGLSWDKGVQLDNVSPYEWAFSTTKAKGDVTFKFLINDAVWAEGDDLTVAKGGISISSPVFAW